MDALTPTPTTGQPLVFVSYSHRDEKWKNRLLPHLRALELAGVQLKVWEDRQIDGGSTWYTEIRQAMQDAAASILLISADFLGSAFCVQQEAKFLLERRANRGMLLIPVLLRDCNWQAHSWLSDIQLLPRDGKCIVPNFTNKSDVVFREVAQLIQRHFRALMASPAAARTIPPGLQDLVGSAEPLPPDAGTVTPKWPVLAEQRVDLTRLPETGSALFGREQELRELDDAWAAHAGSTSPRILALTAEGGVGKTTLVRRWLGDMKRDQFRGAARVFAWSFYAQGMPSGDTGSSESFVEAALRFFGDANPGRGSTWDRGERLGRHVGAERNLLVLDGLEPLQSSGEYDRGRVLDAAVDALLRGLARPSRALCVITTREPLSEFAGRPNVVVRDLDQITPQAGRALLRVARVIGTDAELETLAGKFGPHALSVSLLGAYLAQEAGQGIGPAAALEQLPGPSPLARVLAGIEERLLEKEDLQALKLLALFDRPADPISLRALRTPPAIDGLTENLADLADSDWERLLNRLERLRLVRLQRDNAADLTVESHPMLAAHFGERLHATAPDAWRRGHARLSEHFAAIPSKAIPDTFKEMRPLFRALAHGCKAGRHQAMHDDIYARRMSRGDVHYVTRFLGIVGAELAAVANFFDRPWTRPSAGLDASTRAMVLRSAGFLLRAVGRTGDAMQAMSAGIEAEDEAPDSSKAKQSEAALYLSEMAADLGQLEAAWIYAKHAFALASDAQHEPICIAAIAQTGTLHHQRGRWEQALECFAQAEQRVRQWEPHRHVLGGMAGFNYCALLLELPGGPPRGEDLLVRARGISAAAMSGTPPPPGPPPSDSPGHRGQTPGAAAAGPYMSTSPTGAGLTSAYPRRDTALAALMIGRLGYEGDHGRTDENRGSASRWLNRGLDRLRTAETVYLQPLGFMARARARIHAGEPTDDARSDLERAFEIADRGAMRLCLADIYLCRVELFHAVQPYPWDRPAADLRAAEKLIEECGYWRRRAQLEAARKAVGLGSNCGEPACS
jgi:tetratricopeptide (TPR) repeat protein